MRPPAWMTRAACHGHNPDLWFPENISTTAGQDDADKAVAICNDCPVQADCGAYADTEHILDGIWGGINRNGSSKGIRGSRKRPINHGTPGGYVTHFRRGEKPCLACTNANAAYARGRGDHPKKPCTWMGGSVCDTFAMRDADMCWNHLRMSRERQNRSGQIAGQKDR